MRPIVRALMAAAALASVSVTASSYKTTTYYSNAWCQAPAAAFDATPVTTAAVCSPSECAGTMSLGQKTRDVTCSITDVDTYAATVFGADAPFILMRTFADDACTSEARVSGRGLVVGNCFRDGEASSYRFAVRANATVHQRFFSTPDCRGPIASSVAIPTDDSCVARIKWSAYNIAAMDRPNYRVDTYYVDGECQRPYKIVFTPSDVSTEPVEAVTCAIFYPNVITTTSGRVDPDMTAYTTFGSDKSYVLEAQYSDAACTDDVLVTAYVANTCNSYGGYDWFQYYLDSDGSFYEQSYKYSGCMGYTGRWRLPQNCGGSSKWTMHPANSPAPTTVAPVPVPTTLTPTPTTPATTIPTPTLTTTSPPSSPTPSPTLTTASPTTTPPLTTASPTSTPPPTTKTPTTANLQVSSTANSIAFSIAAAVTGIVAVAGAFWIN